MKIRCAAAILAVVMVFTLIGCSRNRGNAENSAAPTGAPSATAPGNQNDSFEGGGAGGTEDSQNSSRPDNSPEVSPNGDGDGLLNDIGDAAGDLMDGAGDALQDAGDAIRGGGNSMNGAGNTAG